MLNKYLDRLERLINDYRCVELEQFEGPERLKARFHDLVWYHIDPNTGRRTRFLSCRHKTIGIGDGGLGPDLALHYPYDHLVKIWIIEVVNRPVSQGHRKRLVSSARKLLTLMKGDLYEQSSASIQGIFSNDIRGENLFLEFCFQRRLMPKLNFSPPLDRDRTGHSQLDNAMKRLPSDEGLLAIGSIFSRIFANVNPDGTVKSGRIVSMLDAMTATYACLSLASPNRTAAELPLLQKQRLRSYSENNQPLIYYLDWKGSKGYKDYQNHILSSLAIPVEKALNYFYLACEPARILCRFFEQPNQSLGSLLGEFRVEPRRRMSLSFSSQPNLFQLGYALGFYGVDDKISVLRNGADLATAGYNRGAACFVKRKVASLRYSDEISTAINPKTSYSAFHYLFSMTLQHPLFGDRLVVSVEEVQGWWISHVKNTIMPEFPSSYSTGEGSVQLKDAMFCILGSWFYRPMERTTGAVGRQHQSSHYAIASLRSLGTYVARRLIGGKFNTSIFEDYGFPREVKLGPHSLRHYANTLASMSEIPIEVITAWSGRSDPEQTHTYIHKSGDEKADRVRAIISPPEKSPNSIRLVSEKELSQTTNLPASLTSTGLCTQDLNVTPCNYLNDFVSQCVMCPESCHIAGDHESIALLEKDVSYQRARIAMIESDSRLPSSDAMKKWYVIHSRNTFIMSQLVALMKEQPMGTIIRYSKKESEFNLTDLHTKSISRVACTLPDTKKGLEILLDSKEPTGKLCANSELKSLLLYFGLQES